MIMRALLFATVIAAAPGTAAEPPRPPAPMTWTTLGTAGGPIVHADRSQPSNLLTLGDRRWLVDCGDGCLERLAATGKQPSAISAVFISHLHLDHTAGLQALIGLRWMQSSPGTLTIYGPPGIEQVVDGIIASMQPVSRTDPSQPHPAPASTVKAVVVSGGSDLTVDGVRVRAARNSHFDDSPGHPVDNGTQSLSYRFDLGGYAVGYTGDTGVSAAVTALFRGADTIVSEVIDLPGIIANLSGPSSPIPERARPTLIEHLKAQHLTPQQAGAIASEAGARRLVLTHLSIAGPTARIAPTLVHQARETFGGQVVVARDLDTF